MEQFGIERPGESPGSVYSTPDVRPRQVTFPFVWGSCSGMTEDNRQWDFRIGGRSKDGGNRLVGCPALESLVS